MTIQVFEKSAHLAQKFNSIRILAISKVEIFPKLKFDLNQVYKIVLT